MTSIAIEMLESGRVDAVVCVQSDETDRFTPKPVGSGALPKTTVAYELMCQQPCGPCRPCLLLSMGKSAALERRSNLLRIRPGGRAV